jgi:hypothetical protein
MISGKTKLLFAALAVAVVVATPMLARTDHKAAATVGQAPDRTPMRADRANPVLGPDGKLLGAAPDANVRSQLQQNGLPN